MKLQMHDTQKTVITEIKTEIESYQTLDENNRSYYCIFINGLKLRYKNKLDCSSDFQTLLKNGGVNKF